MLDGYIRLYGRRLYGLCLTLCASRFDADDLYQETWLRAMKGFSGYDAGREFEPWLTRICVNLYRSRLRRLSRSPVFDNFSNAEEKDAALSGAAAKNLQFVGLDNYRKLFSDASMFRSVKNTLVFLVGSIVGQNLLGFMMAYFMKRRNHIVRRIVGSCILGGWVMPEIVVAICMYAFFYSKGTGTLNRIITLFGGSPVPWLFSHAMLVVILANIWHGMAYSMMVYQAALDDVPEDIEESAYMDGATRLQNLRYIIIPHVK